MPNQWKHNNQPLALNTVRLLAGLALGLSGLACQGLAPGASPTVGASPITPVPPTAPAPTTSPVPPSSTSPPPTASPQPESTPTLAVAPSTDWPPRPLTEEQKNEVRDCDVETLAAERYPSEIGLDDLATVFDPETGCDWAALAFAHTPRSTYGEHLPAAAIDAYTQAVNANRGFALSTMLYFWFFGQVPLSPAPPLSDYAIVAVEISYHWRGLGDPVDYEAAIDAADSTPTVTTDPKNVGASIEAVDSDLIQVLTPALTDLVPIDSAFSLIPCYDNYPEWTVNLTLEDGSRLELWTDSNYLFFGGPWFTEIDMQTYVQVSTAFAEALHSLVAALELPVGEPAAMSCFGDEVFDKAFP